MTTPRDLRDSGDLAVRPIPPDRQAGRSWRLEIDGAPIEPIGQLVLRSTYGALAYGLTLHGHDGWVFHELGGGGSVIVPFGEIDGEIHIGVVEEPRPLQGGQVQNVPRGFLDPGEDHLEASRRELAEETGLSFATRSPIDLGGAPVNPNSAFFDTRRPDQGVRFFALRLLATEIERRDGALRPVAAIVAPDRWARLAKAIGEMKLIPWWQVAALGDAFSVAAVARLLAWLRLHAHGSPTSAVRRSPRAQGDDGRGP